METFFLSEEELEESEEEEEDESESESEELEDPEEEPEEELDDESEELESEELESDEDELDEESEELVLEVELELEIATGDFLVGLVVGGRVTGVEVGKVVESKSAPVGSSEAEMAAARRMAATERFLIILGSITCAGEWLPFILQFPFS